MTAPLERLLGLARWERAGMRIGLERIEASLLAINSADDERNPPELGIMERELKRVRNGRIYLIPASEETRGHATTAMAKFWKRQLEELLKSLPGG